MRDFEEATDLWRGNMPDGSIEFENPTWVYRHYDTKSRLIYVGVCTEPKERMEDHRKKKWYETSASLFIEVYPLRPLALYTEEYAIELENPLENIKRKRPRSINKSNYEWFLEQSNYLLSGKLRQWVDPHCFNLKETIEPNNLSAPKPISPNFK